MSVIEFVPIDSLKPHPENYRRGDVEAIRDSIRANQFYGVVVVQESTRFICAGNHRWEAARLEGLTEIRAEIIDMDDATAKRILAADNGTSDRASNDNRLLAELLADVRESSGSLAGSGHDDRMLAELLKGLDAEPERNADPDDAPPLPEADPVTQPGDLWELGGHRLLCGDCTSPEHVARVLNGATPPLLLTDPPYCSGGFQESGKAIGSVGTTATHKQIANDRLSTRGYQALIKAAILNSPSDWAYVFTDWKMWTYLFDAVESNGYGVRSMVVWDKGTPGMGRGWRAQHEIIMWAAKKTPPFKSGMTAHGNVIGAKRTGNQLHTTQKPVDLLEQLLAVADFADSVYDPFAGSGSTLIAAHNLGRTFYGLELDPGYCDVTAARWEQYTGEPGRLNGEPRSLAAVTT